MNFPSEAGPILPIWPDVGHHRSGGSLAWKRAVAVEIPGVDDVEILASTANGSVYSGVEAEFDRRVAVKVMRSGIDGAERRFARERRTMGRLSEIRGIAPIYRSGLLDSGEPFLVMPLYSQSLQDILNQGPLPESHALAVASRVADAIAEAHELDVIHLDIKPSNILMDSKGAPFVADFGIAEMTDSSASLSGSMMTPQYAAPERFRDMDPRPAADVYALGAMLFTLLAGRPPFSTEKNTSPAAVMMRIIQDPVPLENLPAEVSVPVRHLIVYAMAKDPNERPTGAEFAATLTSLRSGSGDLPIPPTPGRQPAPPTVVHLESTERTKITTDSRHGGANAFDENSSGVSKLRLAIGALIAIAALVAGVILATGEESITDNPESRSETVDNDTTSTTVAADETGEVEPVIEAPNEALESQVEVPTLANLTREEAERQLTQSGLTANVVEVDHSTIPAGIVIRQEPAPGVSQARDAAVFFEVSLGQSERAVPDLAGAQLASAIDQLFELDFRTQIVEEASEDVREGFVIRTDPEAGSLVRGGGTVIIIQSTGIALVPVPAVVGRVADAAQEQLTASGFEVEIIFEAVANPNDHNRVIRQTPDENVDLEESGVVQIVVGEDPGAG